MFDRKELKTKAKAVLSRSYIMIFLACLAVTLISGGGVGTNINKLRSLNPESMSNVRILLISGIVGLLCVIAVLFTIFIVSPLIVGLKKFMLNTSKGQTNLEDLLFAFKNNYANVTLTMFMKNLYIFLWSLPSFIPLLAGIFYFSLLERVADLVVMVQADSILAVMSLMAISTTLLIFTAIFSIPSFIKELQYSLVVYILADNPDMKWSDAIARSKEMMVGNKWAYVKLLLSFTGWYLLCNFVCCLGNIVLTPYVEATVAQMYIELSGQSADYENNYNPNEFFSGFQNF